jgi:hypothetical protein
METAYNTTMEQSAWYRRRKPSLEGKPPLEEAATSSPPARGMNASDWLAP